MSKSRLTWQKLVWRLYKIIGRVVMAIPITRLPLGNQTLGQRLSKLARRLFSNTLPNPMVAYGHTIYWPSKTFSAPEFALESYEAESYDTWQKLMQPGMVVVDCGAHIGLYSLIAAKLVGKEGKVYSFEPETTNFQLLQKNIATNKYEKIITAVQKAVADKPGEVKLFLGQSGQDSGETSMYATSGTGRKTVSVEALTLDDFFKSEGWPAVKLMKMDIEGAEKAALEGMKQLAKNNSDLKLIIEFNPDSQATAGVSNEEFFYTLKKLGFKKYLVLKDGQKRIKIPDDIPTLVKMSGNGFINLLCEK